MRCQLHARRTYTRSSAALLRDNRASSVQSAPVADSVVTLRKSPSPVRCLRTRVYRDMRVSLTYACVRACVRVTSAVPIYLITLLLSNNERLRAPDGAASLVALAVVTQSRKASRTQREDGRGGVDESARLARGNRPSLYTRIGRRERIARAAIAEERTRACPADDRVASIAWRSTLVISPARREIARARNRLSLSFSRESTENTQFSRGPGRKHPPLGEILIISARAHRNIIRKMFKETCARATPSTSISQRKPYFIFQRTRIRR